MSACAEYAIFHMEDKPCQGVT
ncbi:MAG TPA: hypothetical protein DEF41_00445 [Desulfovibrio sp.]|uniref:Uncharacterized protein n=1 Tax=Nitratidesulfovibrio vulgaris (strain ATCC 29579 / DSM 644 / CCUG 34227 / NCIMB 8303 / VKM B-1760 / Hildenborough) TaxID=882 RepID=Q72FM8_NITV2|nr:hypothetical protein DVU_0185 [Nitratidesulfovibrio vulgaris str. Hildenborough]HBW14624.1 hypothetical protein [Desulfovibrio sp.]